MERETSHCGGRSQRGKGRGIVATCSYEARKFGVHSAQPISRAWRLCPHGIYARPNMTRYAEASQRIMAILLEFTDLVEQVSVDEAFLDVTGVRRLFGTGREIALKIKRRIYEELRLTASVGIAGNKFVAKVASDLEKPDGLVEVEPGKEEEFLRDLPLRRLWGVGAKTEARLLEQGISRIGQLLEISGAELARRLGPNHSEHLCRLARGMDDRSVSPEEGYKSIGHETTFEVDTVDPGLLHDTVLALSEKVAQRSAFPCGSSSHHHREVPRSRLHHLYPSRDSGGRSRYRGPDFSRGAASAAIAGSRRRGCAIGRRLRQQSGFRERGTAGFICSETKPGP